MGNSKPSKKWSLFLFLWLLVAYILCLLPSGCFDWFSSVGSSDSDGHLAWLSGDLIEWAAHAILMAGVAYHLVPMFGGSARRLFSLLCSMFVISLIALSIEWLQGLLPESFSRGFSWGDIWASLAGGLIATVLGFKR